MTVIFRWPSKPSINYLANTICTCIYNAYVYSDVLLPLFSGLKEAQDRVHDYNPLMKDFPINELLAANSLESIKTAVTVIYGHLRKIRTTAYPAQRAIYLVEAISRDLSSQLLKVRMCSVYT